VKRYFYPFVVYCLAIFFLLTFASFALAADSIKATQEPAVDYKPFYVGVFGGFVAPDDLRVDTGSGTQEVQLYNSWTAGAKAGYILPIRWVAAELEYAYLANQDVVRPGSGHFSANNLMANLLLRYPNGMIRPYIGGGIGWSWAEFTGGAPVDERDNAFVWQGVAGINLEIIPSLSADFGFHFFKNKYNDAEITDHIFLVGLNYHFGGAKPVPPPPPPEPAPIVKEKKCPNTPSCCIVDEDGCPIDSDKDGVCDGCDKCPNTPLGCIVDKDGCPFDSDKDGVCDGLDKCPDTPLGCMVDKDGCPVDSDKDGVCDGLDKCSGTPAGVKVDKDGCPLPEIVEKGRTTLEVLFDFDKSTIKGNYSKDIDALADVMKKYGDLNVTIEGYTDNLNRSKKPDYNKKLSQRRADAVKQYLVEKSGIDAKRLTAIGFGAEKPIASNDTEEGRQKNRRVEAAVDYIIKK
jgi:OmpA-OmpF porin, OOP family